MEYLIKIDQFEGPLDLLLHLVKEANIDIHEINMNEITSQYLEYINKWEELNIEVTSEYLVMAATLIEIKSKSLLPIENKEQWEEQEEEEPTYENIKNQLIEYQKYKEITKNLKTLEKFRKEIYTKAPSNLKEMIGGKITNQNSVSINELINALNQLRERKNQEHPITTKVTNKEYSIKKRKNDIKNYLQTKGKTEFTELFKDCNKSFIIVTFLSILELAKEKDIILEQEKNFDKIYLELKVK